MLSRVIIKWNWSVSKLLTTTAAATVTTTAAKNLWMTLSWPSLVKITIHILKQNRKHEQFNRCALQTMLAAYLITAWSWSLTFWSHGQVTTMHCTSTKFSVDSSRRFPFTAQTHKPTNTQLQMHRHEENSNNGVILPPCGVSKVTVLLMSPSLAPFRTTTPTVISENGQSFEVDPVKRSSSTLRLYLHLQSSSAPVGSRHGDHWCRMISSLRTSLGSLVRQNCICNRQTLLSATLSCVLTNILLWNQNRLGPPKQKPQE